MVRGGGAGIGGMGNGEVGIWKGDMRRGEKLLFRVPFAVESGGNLKLKPEEERKYKPK